MAALNIKDPETVRLAAEVAQLAGETKTRAVKVALEERKRRLAHGTPEERVARLRRFLETEIWPQIPPEVRGKPITKEEWDDIMGYGPGGF